MGWMDEPASPMLLALSGLGGPGAGGYGGSPLAQMMQGGQSDPNMPGSSYTGPLPAQGPGATGPDTGTALAGLLMSKVLPFGVGMMKAAAPSRIPVGIGGALAGGFEGVQQSQENDTKQQLAQAQLQQLGLAGQKSAMEVGKMRRQEAIDKEIESGLKPGGGLLGTMTGGRPGLPGPISTATPTSLAPFQGTPGPQSPTSPTGEPLPFAAPAASVQSAPLPPPGAGPAPELPPAPAAQPLPPGAVQAPPMAAAGAAPGGMTQQQAVAAAKAAGYTDQDIAGMASGNPPVAKMAQMQQAAQQGGQAPGAAPGGAPAAPGGTPAPAAAPGAPAQGGPTPMFSRTDAISTGMKMMRSESYREYGKMLLERGMKVPDGYMLMSDGSISAEKGGPQDLGVITNKALAEKGFQLAPDGKTWVNPAGVVASAAEMARATEAAKSEGGKAVAMEIQAQKGRIDAGNEILKANLSIRNTLANTTYQNQFEPTEVTMYRTPDGGMHPTQVPGSQEVKATTTRAALRDYLTPNLPSAAIPGVTTPAGRSGGGGGVAGGPPRAFPGAAPQQAAPAAPGMPQPAPQAAPPLAQPQPPGVSGAAAQPAAAAPAARAVLSTLGAHGVDSSRQKVVNTMADDVLKEARGKAQSGRDFLTAAANMKEAVDKGLQTGTFADWRLTGAKILEGFGAPAHTVNTLMNTADAKQYEAASSEMLGSVIKTFGPQISNADVENAKRMIASFRDSPQMALRYLETLTPKAQQNIDLFNHMWDQYSTKDVHPLQAERDFYAGRALPTRANAAPAAPGGVPAPAGPPQPQPAPAITLPPRIAANNGGNAPIGGMVDRSPVISTMGVNDVMGVNLNDLNPAETLALKARIQQLKGGGTAAPAPAPAQAPPQAAPQPTPLSGFQQESDRLRTLGAMPGGPASADSREAVDRDYASGRVTYDQAMARLHALSAQ